jgi:Calcium binding
MRGRTRARAKNEMREQRIAMEAVVDAYDSSERAMGWYYYLHDKMKVPCLSGCHPHPLHLACCHSPE